MNAEPIPDPTRPAWNYRHLTVALFVGWMTQALVLPCLCTIGAAKMNFAIGFDVVVVLRTFWAYRRHEAGLGSG